MTCWEAAVTQGLCTICAMGEFVVVVTRQAIAIETAKAAVSLRRQWALGAMVSVCQGGVSCGGDGGGNVVSDGEWSGGQWGVTSGASRKARGKHELSCVSPDVELYMMMTKLLKGPLSEAHYSMMPPQQRVSSPRRILLSNQSFHILAKPARSGSPLSSHMKGCKMATKTIRTNSGEWSHECVDMEECKMGVLTAVRS